MDFNELALRMQYEPSILMFGSNYSHLSSTVVNYNWNTVVTTNCDVEAGNIFLNDNRLYKNITSISDMNSNLLNTHNLSVVRLFGEEYPKDEIDDDKLNDLRDEASDMLKRIKEVIENNGIVLIEDYNDPYLTHKDIRKAFRKLYEGQIKIYIFNYKYDDESLDDLIRKGIVDTTEQSINSFFEKYISPLNDYDIDDKSVKIYIDTESSGINIVNIDKTELREIDSFAKLLNIEMMNEKKIPPSLCEDYFYAFLKNSVKEPQWYGYREGYNIHRIFEDELYRKTIQGLKNVGNENNKPLLLEGQANSGKSIAIASLAYKIFNEKKYPVIFINDPDIKFVTDYSDQSSKKDSDSFEALDLLLRYLEDKGAKAILVIWDQSSFCNGRDISFRLYRRLLSRGRKVFLLSTSYESNIGIDSQDNIAIASSKFEICRANIAINDEVEQLKNILVNTCHYSVDETNELIKKITESKLMNENGTFLSMLYFLDVLRDNLNRRVTREASKNLDELEKVVGDIKTDELFNNVFENEINKLYSALEISNDENGFDELNEKEVGNNNSANMADFAACIAICSKFKLKMPYDFALRILNTYNYKVLRVLTDSTFFSITTDKYDNYEISFRTPLEANMYLIDRYNDCNIHKTIVDYIVKMLGCMKSSGAYEQSNEVELCVQLIRVIGPNVATGEDKKKYEEWYESLIEAMSQLREEQNIWEPRIIAQEITYLREFYGKNLKLDVKTRISKLNTAIDISDQLFRKEKTNNIVLGRGLKNSIIVDVSNSKILLNKLEDNKNQRVYKDIQNDLYNVIRIDSTNAFAYSTLLETFTEEYESIKNYSADKTKLLADMCAVADEINYDNSDNPNLSENKIIIDKISTIYSLLDDGGKKADEYNQQLLDSGSAAGLYIKARKMLNDNDIDYNKPILTEKQKNVCQDIYDMFNDERYKDLLSKEASYQHMYLNVVWLLHNGEPIFSKEENRKTRMNLKTWNELCQICRDYILNFIDDGVRDIPNRREINIRYLYSLCLGQLGSYRESYEAGKKIMEDSMRGISRAFTQHLLCDEYGNPIKFDAVIKELNKSEADKTGRLVIKEFGQNTKIYFFGPRLKISSLEVGQGVDNVEIGYSEMGLKAVRGI